MPHRTLHQLLKALILLFDVCLIGTSILVAYWLRFESGWLKNIIVHKGATPPLDFYFQLIPLQTAVFLLTLRKLGLYRADSKVTFETALTLFKASAIALIATLAAIFFLYHAYEYSRWVMILATGLSAVFLFFDRLAVQKFREAIQESGIGVSRIAVVGFNPTTEQFIRALEANADSGYQFIGVIAGEQPSPTSSAYHILGGSQDIRSIAKKYHLHELFITSPAISHEEIWRIVHNCEGCPIQINVLPDLYEVMIGRTRITEFDGIPIVKLKDIPIQGWRGMVKRGMDILLSSLALILLSPVMSLIAIAVKLTSPGKMIFRQERIGRDGKPFYIYKFRSMRLDAEENIGHVWAASDDSRQTAMGRFLRRWALDELPQFFNVLKGEMSLVGPRPEMSGLIDKFSNSIPHYLDRHRVKCGMTGWAVVNGLRGNTSLEERIRYDLYYIENWSLGFDIKIILKTLWAIREPPT